MEEPAAGYLSPAVLQKGAALFALALVAGCGSSIAGDTPEPVTRHLVYQKVTGETGIWIADVDGSKPRLLVRDGDVPVISPDGKWVAYVGGCDRSGQCKGSYVVSTSEGEPRLLSSHDTIAIGWSSDSERVLAIDPGKHDGVPDSTLLSIGVASGKEVTLAHGDVYGASFSPDGKQIVFAVAQKPSDEGFIDEKIDLFVTGRDGGEARQITDDGQSGWPVWGPSSIAFAKLIPSPGWARDELWQIQPNGSERRPIIAPLPKRFLGQGYAGLVPIDWSEDGGALLAGWGNEWGTIPIAVDPETGNARQLVEYQASEPVSLSRSGDLALVVGVDNVGDYPERNTVLIVPYAGGKAHLVAHGATAASWNR
jgi:dipeptidyl aminopeptidase/acylaminoacyl peptidase